MAERDPGRAFERIVAMALLLAAPALQGCSIRGLAVNALADSLAASGDVFSSDEDPELVRDALPFALKTMETLLAEKPHHAGLLLSACSGFTGYAYAFVETEAERLEDVDWEASERASQRALGLYLRARGYCLRALEQRSPGVGRRLEIEPATALAGLAAADVPLLYWTAASWGSAISLALDRPDISIDWPAVRALGERVLDLDESFDHGAAHQLMMVLEALPAAMGGSAERARRHFERAVELSGGGSAGVYVGFAQSVALKNQNREEFVELLQKALAIDVDAEPARRLVNVVAQRRARWLLERVDDLFL